MSDNLILEEPIEPAAELAPTRSTYLRFARYVSIILSPSIVSLPLLLLIALYHQSNLLLAAGYTALTLIFLSIGPLLYIAIGVRKGHLSDMDVTRRSERLKPFLFGLASATVVLVMLIVTNAPHNLQNIVLVTIICGLIFMIITLWWKISIHASALSGAVTFVAMLYGTTALPLFSLVILVSWSRVVMRRHTLGQVIAGSVLGAALTTTILLLRGM